jgi:hypothetical protein
MTIGPIKQNNVNKYNKAARKLSQDATIIAIIGKINPIIACALAIRVPEGLDSHMLFGLGTQMVRPNT